MKKINLEDFQLTFVVDEKKKEFINGHWKEFSEALEKRFGVKPFDVSYSDYEIPSDDGEDQFICWVALDDVTVTV